MTLQSTNYIELMKYEVVICGKVFGEYLEPSSSELESTRKPSLVGNVSFSKITEMLDKQLATPEIISLSNYIERHGIILNDELFGPRYGNCMSFYARTHGDQVEFYLKLEEKLINGLVGMFPNPVLSTMGKVETGPVHHDNPYLWLPYYNNLFSHHSLNLKDIFIAMRDNSEEDHLQLLDSSTPSSMLDPLGTVAIKLTLDISVEWTTNYSPPIHSPAQITALLHMSTDATAKLIQTLYGNDSTKDATIVSEEGTEIKCHRFILEGHSSALAAMLSRSTGMKESQSGRIEMKDMSAAGVNNLLRYLYCMKILTSDLCSEMVLEMFQAAHKYELKDLEETLHQLLLQSSEQWFTPNTALELYYYVRNSEGFAIIRDHALRILTRMSPEELRHCERYQELSSEEKVDLPWKLFGLAIRGHCCGANSDTNTEEN